MTEMASGINAIDLLMLDKAAQSQLNLNPPVIVSGVHLPPKTETLRHS